MGRQRPCLPECRPDCPRPVTCTPSPCWPTVEASLRWCRTSWRADTKGRIAEAVRETLITMAASTLWCYRSRVVPCCLRTRRNRRLIGSGFSCAEPTGNRGCNRRSGQYRFLRQDSSREHEKWRQLYFRKRSPHSFRTRLLRESRPAQNSVAGRAPAGDRKSRSGSLFTRDRAAVSGGSSHLPLLDSLCF